MANMAPVDLIRLALRDAGVSGQGQAPNAEDNNDAFSHLNLMLAGWNRRRWLVYHLVDVPKTSTGAASYTVGVGGDFSIPRPDRLEAAFVRYTGSTPNSDWPVQVLEAREDYNRFPVKTVSARPSYVWYDAAYPTGQVYFYPVAPTGYDLHLTLKQELTQFSDMVTAINLPPEYQEALLFNLGLRLRLSYQMDPDQQLERLAAASLATIRGANAAVPQLRMPAGLNSRARFNIITGTGG